MRSAVTEKLPRSSRVKGYKQFAELHRRGARLGGNGIKVFFYPAARPRSQSAPRAMSASPFDARV